MEPIKGNESNVVELPQQMLQVEKEASLGVQITRLIVVNVVGFLAGRFAGQVFDNYIAAKDFAKEVAKPQPQDVIDI